MKKSNIAKIFITFIISFVILVFAVNNFLSHENLYFDFYADQLAYERIVELLDQQRRWEWLSFAFIPVVFLFKFFIISCILLAATFLSGYEVRFREVFHVTVQAEFVFLFPMLLKLIWFGFFFRDYALEDLISFAPLSLINFFDSSAIQKWFLPLLSSVSLFELAYWFLLSYGIYQLIDRSYTHSFGLVAVSYGSVWLVWQVFVIFLIINLS